MIWASMFACRFKPEQIRTERTDNDSIDVVLHTAQHPHTSLSLRTSGIAEIRAMAARWRAVADEFDAIAASIEAETDKIVRLAETLDRDGAA